MVDNATDRDGGAPRSRGRNGLAAGRLSRGLLWTMLALGAAVATFLVASALEAPDGRAAGAPPRQAAALLGAMLLLVPALFSIAKRGGRASHPPLWFAGHALAGLAGLLLVSWHAAGGRLLSLPGTLLALLLFIVLQGTLARLLVPARLAQQFGSRATAFHLSGGPDRQALVALVARKRALLQALEPDADEALFSPNLKHAVRRPRLTWRYARLAAQEADLVGARRRAGRLLAQWRRLHIAAALVFAIGLLAHVVVVTLFAGYAAAGRPIDWWHLAAWGA